MNEHCTNSKCYSKGEANNYTLGKETIINMLSVRLQSLGVAEGTIERLTSALRDQATSLGRVRVKGQVLKGWSSNQVSGCWWLASSIRP